MQLFEKRLEKPFQETFSGSSKISHRVRYKVKVRTVFFLVGFCLLDRLLRNTKLLWLGGQLSSPTPSWAAPFLPVPQQNCVFPHIRGLHRQLKQLECQICRCHMFTVPNIHIEETQTSNKAKCCIIASLIH